MMWKKNRKTDNLKKKKNCVIVGICEGCFRPNKKKEGDQ